MLWTAFRKQRHQDIHRPAAQDPGAFTSCASHVPTNIPIPHIVEPCDDVRDGESGESFNMRRPSDNLSYRRSLQSCQSPDSRSIVSNNTGLLLPHNPDPYASRLTLASDHNSVHGALPSAGETISILPSTLHGQIDCILSTELSRYSRKHKIPQEKPKVIIGALETEYAFLSPSGWERYVHPDGCPYWCHLKRVDPEREIKVLTDVDLLDENVLLQTNRFVDIIFEYIRAKNLQLKKDVELVVETVKYDGHDDYRCGYYFVYHKNRCLFWLQDFDISNSLWEVQAQTSLSHIKLEIEVCYWQHWEFFCNIQVATEEILDDLMNILTTDLVDLQTSHTSNALFRADELQSYLKIIEMSRVSINASRKALPFFVGRLMSMYMLLAANVSFLAIQSVDNIKNEPYRSPSQIASYLSTLASISSMIIGLLLVRQTRTKSSASAQDAADYLRVRQYRVVGHEPLAIMYSLPYAFLMWAMVFLMIALLLVCFLGTTLVTRIIPGLAALTCITMIVWCIWMGWDRGNDPHESLWNTFVNALSRWRSHFFETLKPWGYLCGKREQDPENPPAD
ncbi:hypothetical protein EYR40_009121 [Pleurotus pulmonarius]|nr:hypothetical protein EYR40_009121 [Pleurotus pulmonarius]